MMGDSENIREQAGERRLGRADFGLAALVAGGLAALMIPYCLREIWTDDTGEFQVVSYVMGIAHAPGYPLIILLGKLFTLLPVGSVAFRVTLMTVTLGAATAGIVYLLVVLLGGKRWAGWSAACLFAAVPVVWRLSTMPEAYIPLTAAAALMIVMLLLWARTGATLPLVTAAAAWGFYCINRPSAVLYAPAVGAALWMHRGRFASARAAVGKLGLSAAAFGLPVLIGLGYLWVRDKPDTPVNWIEDINRCFRYFPENDFSAATKARRLYWLLSAKVFQNRLDFSPARGAEKAVAFWREMGPPEELAEYQDEPEGARMAVRGLLRASPLRWGFPALVFAAMVVGFWWLALRSAGDLVVLLLFCLGDAFLLFGYRDAGILEMCLTGCVVVFVLTGLGLSATLSAVTRSGRVGAAAACVVSLLVLLQAAPAKPLLDPDFGRRSLESCRLDSVGPGALIYADWGWVPVLWYGRYVDPGREDIEVRPWHGQREDEDWKRFIDPYLGRRPIYLVRRSPSAVTERFAFEKHGRLWKIVGEKTAENAP